MLTRFYLGFGNRAEVEVIPTDSSSESAILEMITTINRMLEARRADERITRENFERFTATKVPLVAVDGVLFFVGVIPSNEQLSRALEIMAKSAE